MSVFTNPASRSVEAAMEYTQAILALLGDRDPIEVLSKTPAALRKLVTGASAEQLGIPEAPGKWSVRIVVQHLADSDLVWGWRLRLVLAQDRPPITGYDQDAWAGRLRYAEADVDDALADFEQFRRSNLRLLARVPEPERDRVGLHAERGEESVAHIIRLTAGHDVLHLRQVERILSAVGPLKND
jgi:hypothetical protein